jgi:cytochrome b561
MPTISTPASSLPRRATEPAASSARHKQPRVVRVMHWITATLVFAMLASGLIMVRMDDGHPLKYEVLYAWHQSIGILTLAVVNLRMLVRLRSKLLPLPPTLAPALRRTASVVYAALYGLMLTVPVMGLVMSAAYPQGQGLAFFGLQLPSFLAPDASVYNFTRTLHWTLAYALGVLIVLHLGAAIKHRFFDRPEHDVLQRML